MSFVKNEFQQLKWQLTQVLKAPYSLVSSICNSQIPKVCVVKASSTKSFDVIFGS